jgi:biopolymer transport protein TolR
MVFSLGSSKKSGKRRKKAHLVAEINVTPMVDVMLVLLVIFMITAPLLTVGVPVDLPKTKASALNEQEEPLTVTVNGKGIYLQESEVELSALAPRLVAITGANPEARIYVRGDKGIPYGQVMEVMGAISSGGFKKVALISEFPTGGPIPSTPQTEKRK